MLPPCPPIPESLIEESFIHSSGPGGQNVNKVATAVQLRFHAAGWWMLSPAAYTRLGVIAGRKLTPDGYLTLTVRTSRSQGANRAEARRRLAIILSEALEAPKPRRATKPTYGSKKKRLETKARTAQRKSARKKVAPHEL